MLLHSGHHLRGEMEAAPLCPPRHRIEPTYIASTVLRCRVSLAIRHYQEASLFKSDRASQSVLRNRS